MLSGGLVSSGIASTAITVGCTYQTVASAANLTALSADLLTTYFVGFDDPGKAAKRLENCVDIELGKFQYDEDWRGTGDVFRDIWQVAARFTPWESSQTNAGSALAHIHNLTGNVNDVHYFHGATVLDVDYANEQHTGQNIGGSYIIMEGYEGIRTLEHSGLLSKASKTLIHEYGHYRQSRIYGPIGYYIGGLNSALHPKRSDSKAWFERDASNQGYYYFKDIVDDWSNYQRYGNQGIDYLGLINLLFLF